MFNKNILRSNITIMSKCIGRKRYEIASIDKTIAVMREQNISVPLSIVKQKNKLLKEIEEREVSRNLKIVELNKITQEFSKSKKQKKFLFANHIAIESTISIVEKYVNRGQNKVNGRGKQKVQNLLNAIDRCNPDLSLWDNRIENLKVLVGLNTPIPELVLDYAI